MRGIAAGEDDKMGGKEEQIQNEIEQILQTRQVVAD